MSQTDSSNKDGSRNREPFPIKLFNVLNYCPYVQWSNDGDSFVIYNVEKFENEVMLPNFNNSCMLSFTRQLHIYGFRKLIDGRRTRIQILTNFAGFQHPFFKKNRPELLMNVRRKKRTKIESNKTLFISENHKFIVYSYDNE